MARSHNLFGGIVGNQVRILRTVESGVDAAHCTAGQTAVWPVIEPLDVFGCEPDQLLISETGSDVILDMATIVSQRTGLQSICHILQPLVESL